MRLKIKLHHLLLIGAVTFGSCRKDYVQVQPPTVITTPVTYTADIYPIVVAYGCGNSGCHDGSTPPNLSSDAASYTDLTTNGFVNTANPSSSSFYINVTPAYVVSFQMPDPSNPLSAAEQAKILAWITQGALH